MNEKKVSIIVPVFRVEPYITKCIESIRTQNYSNLEIIIVNDNTDDNSMDICSNIIGQDKRFKIINLERNVGVGVSRNIGLYYATGKYVYFLDSDDYLEKDAMAKLSSFFCQNQEVILGRFQSTVDGVKQQVEYDESDFKFLNMFSKNIYSMEFLNKNKIRFPGWRVAQDQVFLLKVFCASPTIVDSEVVSFTYCRYTDRFNKTRYSTDIAKDHVAAEIEMLDIIIKNDKPEYGKAVFESIAKINKGIGIIFDHMDIMELEEYEYIIHCLMDKLSVYGRLYEKSSRAENTVNSIINLLEQTKREKHG